MNNNGQEMQTKMEGHLLTGKRDVVAGGGGGGSEGRLARLITSLASKYTVPPFSAH